MANISFRHRDADADTNTNTNTNANGHTSTVDPYFPIFSSLHDDPFLPLPELITHFNIHSLAHQDDDTVSDPESVILNGPDLLDRENQAESTVSIHANAIRVVGFGSDSDSEDNQNSLAIDFNSGDEYGLDVSIGNGSFGDGVDYDDARVTIPLCWDSLQLEDHRENNEDFEWEEVDGRLDEREVLSMFIDEDEASVSLSISPLIAPEDLVSVERVGGLDHLEWQVLLNANNLDHDHNSEPYSGSHDDYIYTAESEMLFGQFTENENAMMGQPPATKSVVEKLPSVVFTKEDVESNNALCAVCKDDINVGERVKQLPCLHRYHGECIVPWLGIRNTCPVCRYELPTDDADYEQRKMADTSADHLQYCEDHQVIG
ncbi:E3 ubiquitin-protein ligase CIP8-like [Populus alba x Populus x berolinensis]|nr:E3 ubiquitin-protein ligase CIP8-like [Populus alba x Populus x berolinensis]